MTHKVPDWPFAPGAFAPRMSDETIAYHYGKHLQTYLDNVNKLVEGTPFAELPLKDIVYKADGALLNNAAQAWNHIIFFKQLTPEPKQMSPQLSQSLAAAFGSVDNFKQQLFDASMKLFGSGWVWLAVDEKKQLQILSMPNAGNPLLLGMRPVFCVDLWEHAYYLDYRNRRADYLQALWQLADWERVEHRMTHNEWPQYF